MAYFLQFEYRWGLYRMCASLGSKVQKRGSPEPIKWFFPTSMHFLAKASDSKCFHEPALRFDALPRTRAAIPHASMNLCGNSTRFYEPTRRFYAHFSDSHSLHVPRELRNNFMQFWEIHAHACASNMTGCFPDVAPAQNGNPTIQVICYRTTVYTDPTTI